MANIKFSELPSPSGALADDDLLALTQNPASTPTSVKVPLSTLRDYLTDAISVADYATPESGDTVLGVKAGQVRRFGAGPTFAQLSGDSGSGFVGFLQDGASAVARRVMEKLRDNPTVEDWGAVGDGVTDDSAAVLNMIADTGGTLRLLDKEYFVGNLVIPPRESLTIIGKARPKANNGLTKLENGSILIGDLDIRANTLHLENFGVDHGTGRALGYDAIGVFASAKVGELGVRSYVKGFAALGPSGTGVPTESHGLAVQGYDHNFADDLYFGKHYHGLVMKGRNVHIGKVDCDELGWSGVFVKSDTGELSGSVLNGTVQNVVVDDVQHRAAVDNTTAGAVIVMASTASISKVQIGKVYQQYGKAPVILQGGGLISDPTLSDVIVGSVICDSCQYALFADGYTYDWKVSNIEAINPATGRAVYMGSNSLGWSITNLHMKATMALGGTTLMDCYGYGTFDNITVRATVGGPYSINVAGGSLGSIRTGKVSGDVSIQNEGALAGINGATADTETPTLKLLPGSVIKLSGRFNLTASTNKFFCNLPISTGKQMVFACGGIDSGGNYVTQAVRLNDFQLSIEPSLPAGFQKIDLSGITIPL